MIISFLEFGKVKAATVEELPPFVAAELLMRLKGRADYKNVEVEAEEEEAYSKIASPKIIEKIEEDIASCELEKETTDRVGKVFYEAKAAALKGVLKVFTKE